MRSWRRTRSISPQRLTDILTPSDREAFNRALQQITDRSAQLVAETIEQDGPMEEA